MTATAAYQDMVARCFPEPSAVHLHLSGTASASGCSLHPAAPDVSQLAGVAQRMVLHEIEPELFPVCPCFSPCHSFSRSASDCLFAKLQVSSPTTAVWACSHQNLMDFSSPSRRLRLARNSDVSMCGRGGGLLYSS